MNRFLWTFGAAVGVSCGSLTADVTIEQIAPDNVILIAGNPDFQASLDRADRVGLSGIWNEPQVQELWKDAMDEAGDGLSDLLQRIGVGEEDLNWPTGAVGYAMFGAMDEELGTLQPAFLFMGDWGEHADGTADVIQAALDEAEREDILRWEDSDLLGRRVRTIEFIEPDEDEVEEFEHFDEFGNMGGGMDDLFESFGTFHLVRDGSRFLLCTHIDTLGDALDRIDGRLGQSAGEREDFQAIYRQLGEDSDAYAMFLTRDVQRLLASNQDMMMVNMMIPMLEPVFGRVGGIASGIRVREDGDSMLEMTISGYLPDGKVGLLTLVDAGGPREDVPDFAGLDTAGYWVTHFNFDKVVEVLDTIIRSNPMLAMEGEQIMTQIRPILEEVTASLGPRIHNVTTITEPIEADSAHSVMAIEAHDQQRFTNALNQFAPQMGLEPRDFLGYQIYEIPPEMLGGMGGGPGGPGMGGPQQGVSVGIGAGFVIVGQSTPVENTLRSFEHRDGAGLENQDMFRRAVNALGDDEVIAWGYDDLVKQLKHAAIQSEKQFADMVDDLAEQNPDLAEEMRGMGNNMNDIQKAVSEIVPKYFGPMVWTWRSVDDGFIGKFQYLRPDNRN